MNIKWNEVTRFSQIVALVVFLIVFAMGIFVGMQVEKKMIEIKYPFVSMLLQTKGK